MSRDPGSERLGQVDSGPAAFDAAAAGRRHRRDLRPRRRPGLALGTEAGEPGVRRGLVLQEDVVRGELVVCREVLRHGPDRDAGEDPEDPEPCWFPDGPEARGYGAPVSGNAAEGRARARAAHLA